ncbi:unnamed protein product [Mytilus edulis]|uniref:Uncharacterized protein n=1 Tax=Mytilus edulis TaxID=6550 RepID=A0A8S3VFJ9_MYTED|nr:unnamed protein product [Mytilus edulis]
MLKYPELLTQLTLQQLSMTPFLILCSIGCTLGNLMHDSGSDYAFVDLSNVLEHKTRHKRQTDEAPCDLKEELSLPISYKNHKKTLQLKKNKRFSPENIPLLIQDEVGYLVKKKKVKKNEVTALYYYEEDGLRFPIMVKCRFAKDCSSSRCEIKGDLLTKDELIEIAGSAAEKKAEYDKSIHKVPHNVKYLPGFEDTGTDDTRIPGLDPEGHPDDKLPPVLKASKKLKMEDILSKEALRKIAKEKEKNKGKRQKRQTEEQLFDEREHVLDLLMTNDFQFFQK